MVMKPSPTSPVLAILMHWNYLKVPTVCGDDLFDQSANEAAHEKRTKTRCA